MLSRLLHAAIAFVVTGALHQAYVASVAPLVDPPPQNREVQSRPRAAGVTRGQEAVAKYQQLLAAYFKPDHWTSQTPPKVFENGQMMLVIDDFEQTDDGRIVARRCAMLMFPTPRDRGGSAPRDAIILEPSGGAEMEGQTAGAAAAGFGRMERAWLHGDVRIYSDMGEAGPADDLSIKTREIYVNQDLIRTDQWVDMRLGPHFGGGRGIEIRLLATNNDDRAATDSLTGRFESLEISDEVSLTIVPTGLSLPGDDQPEAGAQPEPPLRIKSRGPFRIDFGNYVASFIDKVEVRQVHEGGVLDTLYADEINLYFERLKANKKTAARASSSPLGAGFELASIKAIGAPVKLRAPSREAHAACKEMWIELRQLRVTVEGEEGEEVSLAYRGAEIHAPFVQYQHPPENTGRVLGELVASGGGFLEAIVDENRPREPLKVAWTESLRIDRVGDRPVLSIRGRPRLSLGSTGRMWADQLELALIERPLDPAAAAASPLPWAVAPDRLTAVGNVAIDSPELMARVERLGLTVTYPPEQAKELGLHGADGAGRDQRSDPLARLGRAPRRTYRVTGKRLELTSVVRDGKPDVSQIEITDHVLFEETPDPGAKDAPLSVTAARVRVADADTPSAKIDIIGAAATDPAGQPAQITARGAKLLAPQINIVRGRSRVQIESPGEAQLLVDRDLSGAPLPRPEPLTITWQKWMRLDHDRLVFRGQVLCQNQDKSSWLSTQQLGVLLSQEVKFDGAANGARAEVIQLDCSEGVVAEFDQRDANGLTSHQHIELVSILANQKTGEIRGQGPGWLESVHLATGKNPLAAIVPPGVAPRGELSADSPGQKLRHLRVDFVRGVGGNVHQRRVTLLGDVRAVYGPVDSWEQRLQRAIGAGPGPNVVWLTCDELQVGESPLARVNRPQNASGLAELELSALGNVKIDGQAPGKGLFAASAARANYDEYKAMFIIEGGAARPATITHQEYVGAPVSEDVARKLTYYLRTGEVTQEGTYKMQFNQFDIGRPPNTTQQR